MNSFNISNSIGFRNKSSIAFSLMSIFALMILPTTISDVFADEKNNLVWQLVFIKNDECSPNDTIDSDYAGLTSKYFELYEFENIVYDVNCMTESEYKEHEINENVDLLILIYDDVLGKKILAPNNLDGVYIHSGNDRSTNHLIILCMCSNFDISYERTLPSWVLSHELSHFVLSYKGYPLSGIQENIHELEKGYDMCVGTNFQDSACKELKMSIRPESSTKDYVVMAPYEPAVGNKIVKYIPDDYSDTSMIELQRDLAKMWVIGSIDNTAYSNSLIHMINSPLHEHDHESEPFLEIPNGFIIAETAKPQDVEWDEYLYEDKTNDESISILLEHIPFDLEQAVEEIETADDLPNWFKTRALLWSEKRVSDKVFFDGIEHLVRFGYLGIDKIETHCELCSNLHNHE